MNPRKIQQIAANIFERCKNKERKCFVENCQESAINSHLLQKNRVLQEISEQSHFYEVCLRQFPTQHFSIVKRGHNVGMTFKGLCNRHDTEMFFEVEQDKIDFNTYRDLLLLSYRAVLREYREKEIMLEVYRRIAQSKNLSQFIQAWNLKWKFEAEQYLLWDTEFLLVEMNKDLANNSESFLFKVIELPKLPICVSAIYSTESIADSFSDLELDPKNKRLINGTIINILPYPLCSYLIIGCHKLNEENCAKEFVDFQSKEMATVFKKISDILLRNITWACSESFYNSSLNRRKAEIIKQINFFTKRNQFTKTMIDINLFEKV